jgi:hypothetical protein
VAAEGVVAVVDVGPGGGEVGKCGEGGGRAEAASRHATFPAQSRDKTAGPSGQGRRWRGQTL